MTPYGTTPEQQEQQCAVNTDPPRECTCHPDDRLTPCPKRHALSECWVEAIRCGTHKLVPTEVIEFLDGSAPLDGKWFGEFQDEVGYERPYWWRAYLRPNDLAYDKATRTIVKAPPVSPRAGRVE